MAKAQGKPGEEVDGGEEQESELET